jgi:hypothetical protein
VLGPSDRWKRLPHAITASRRAPPPPRRCVRVFTKAMQACRASAPGTDPRIPSHRRARTKLKDRFACASRQMQSLAERLADASHHAAKTDRPPRPACEDERKPGEGTPGEPLHKKETA